MTQWAEVQEKARKLINEGIGLLKTGAKDAGLLAGSAANATRLQISIKQNRLEMYKVLHDLGLKLYEGLPKGGPSGGVTLTSEMEALINRARTLDEKARDIAERASKLTIVCAKGNGSRKPPAGPNADDETLDSFNDPPARKRTKAHTRRSK